MRYRAVFLLVSAILLITVPASQAADLAYAPTMPNHDAVTFPNLALDTELEAAPDMDSGDDMALTQALWPFGSGDDVAAVKPKSTRKAFFLSLLLPGLGEWYVGSKRSFAFLGIEAFAWYLYLTNTQDGNDLEDEYEAYANKYWHYTDTTDSNGDPLGYNYWGYLKNNERYDIGDDISPDDYETIAEHIEDAGESHSLPSTKTQQYYEMIGKYDHFVYGWEDIDDLNPQLLTDGVPNGNYAENTANINSNLRTKYMSIRGDSNDKLNTAQRGLYIMMINRVLSAIDAGRLAYKHNKALDSDLSMVRVRMVQKRIIDRDVPMLMVYKPF